MNARWHVWPSKDKPDASSSSDDQLSITATSGVAGFQVSRIFKPRFAESYIFKFTTAATAQVAGWRRGRQLGLISFLASAAVYNGVKFDGYAAAHSGLVSYNGAGPVRKVAAVRGATAFPPSIHL